MSEYIYSMLKARKKVGDKLILDDVTMAFLPGAKIGMVGPNGAGKSTILKIMAGLDEPSNGEAILSPGYSVGILLQEPPLNEDKDVLGNVEEGVWEIKAKLDRYNEISAQMADPDADFDALMEEMGQLQEAIDAADAWDLDNQLEQAMDALSPKSTNISGLAAGAGLPSCARRAFKAFSRRQLIALAFRPGKRSWTWLRKFVANAPRTRYSRATKLLFERWKK